MKAKTMLKETNETVRTVLKLSSAVSTNDLLKQEIAAGRGVDCIVIAERQTGGRGRGGNRFFSPAGGTYFSFAAPYPSPDPTLTASVGVAVCRVLRSKGIDARIKWVNDVYVDGKKAGGILCEKKTGPDGVEYAVIGVGLNTGSEQFPEEIADTACRIDAGISPERLALLIVNEFDVIRGHGLDIDEYRSLSLLIGKKVRWTENGADFSGLVVGTDEKCGLTVETGSGVRVLRSGEVNTVRPLYEDIDKAR